MGAFSAEYRCSMTDIRHVTEGDFDAVFDLLTARSRAAFGFSAEQPAFLRQRWDAPSTDNWVAVENGTVVGYASLDEGQDFVHAAMDPRGRRRADRPPRAPRARSAGSRSRRGRCLGGCPALRGGAAQRLHPRPRGPPHVAHARRRARRSRWPADVTVRSYTDADAERVHAFLDEQYAGWDESYVGRSHDGWLTFMTEHDDFDPAMWFLVERDGELVACALHWKESQGAAGSRTSSSARASVDAASPRRCCTMGFARMRSAAPTASG